MISGMNASKEVRQLTCAPEAGRGLVRSSTYSPETGKPGPLIGWPIRTVRPGWVRQDCRGISRADVFVIWERNVYYVKCDK